MFKLNYRFSRTARLGFLAIALLLAGNFYMVILNNYFLTDVIVGYATQNAQLKRAFAQAYQECLGGEGYDGQSSWDRYQDKYAGPGLMSYIEEQLTGTSRTHRMHSIGPTWLSDPTDI